MMDPQQIDIKEISRPELVAWLAEQGMPAYRAGQILKWVYLRQTDDFGRMTDLSYAHRELLSKQFKIKRLQEDRIQTASDGTRKYRFVLDDGKCIESVLIPERTHYTLCVSTQVGCAQACRFCLTGQGGFHRNMTGGEIIGQIRDVQHDLKEGLPLKNIVFMGMGEPLANYDNLIRALQTITDSDHGLKISKNRITVSTAGLVPRMADLGRDTQVNLAVSLNATENTTRDRLMPINRRYPIEKLLDACRTYPLAPSRRITFEYILIQGVNDSENDARRLAKLLRPIRSKINLIPFNPHGGCDFERPSESVILRFQEILIDKDYTVMIRKSKGQEISAACGQLIGDRNR
jgi:23S rRNA (adenine2503-C2)-methyltransferase